MMKSFKRLALLACVAAASVMCVTEASAQAGGGGGQGGQGGGRRGQGGGGPGGGNFDPAQFQQMQLDNARERLEITDETEWTAIRPLVEKVIAARTEVQAFSGGRGGRGGRGGGMGGGPGGGMGGQQNPAVAGLTTAVESGSADQIKAALTKYRDARKEAEAKLTAAQDSLKKVLKVKQEAVALQMGYVN
jgi:hypothetical protein